MLDGSVRYRPFQRRDAKTLRNIIGDAWSLNDYTTRPLLRKMLLQHYLYTYLSIQNFSEIAVRDGEPVGILLGRVNRCFHKWKKARYWLEAGFLSLLLRMSQVGRVYLRDAGTISRVDARLIAGHGFDGELVMFAVDRACRGQGVGRQLLTDFRNFAKERQAQHMFLYTDDYSNVDYYRARGYQELAETAVDLADSHGPAGFYVFVFEV